MKKVGNIKDNKPEKKQNNAEVIDLSEVKDVNNNEKKRREDVIAAVKSEKEEKMPVKSEKEEKMSVKSEKEEKMSTYEEIQQNIYKLANVKSENGLKKEPDKKR